MSYPTPYKSPRVPNQTPSTDSFRMNTIILAALVLAAAVAVSEASYGNRPRYSAFKYAAAKVTSGGCPYGWHQYNNHCYWFSREKLNWYRASMKCTAMGGYLASVDQSHENTYVRHMLSTYGFRRGAWMALNDVLRPNKHRWCWGFIVKPCHKFDWYGQEPVYHTTGDYNCGIFWRSYKYHWHVDSCGQGNHYVCERPLGKPCLCVY
ncbi:perlucin-like protein [Ostrea edulis]|uniref:perlucin-like protein n=1 Tax=Ostrea edulis TaxID=37623 RepID=UPI0024AF0402|nr:perlucin-like protein [Ostrea edulis]